MSATEENSQRETRQEMETRDTQSQSGQETLDNVEALSLMQSYFDSKFKSLKRELTHESDDDSRKIFCQHREFKFKSNKMQFEFNSGIIDSIEEVTKLLETGAKTKPKKRLNLICEELRKRNKLIKIADRSPARWSTVDEYVSDEIASDSEDEKKLRAAESRAIVKRRNASKQKFHNNSMQPFLVVRQQVLQPQACFPQPQPFRPPPPAGRISYFNSTQHFQRPAFRMQAKPTDLCLACGQFGHRRRNCPVISNPASFGRSQPQQKTKTKMSI